MSEEFKYIPYSPYDDKLRGLIRGGGVYNLKDAGLTSADGYQMSLSGVLLRPAADGADELIRDLDFLKEMYPEALKEACVAVEEECDRLEYEGSPMLMEYPDKEELRRVARRACGRLEKQKQSGVDAMLRNIVEVLTCNEFCVRRDRHRRCRRRFYQ